MATTTDFEILEELEDLFKTDNDTYRYTVESFLDIEDIPNPDICPCINIIPVSKPREVGRIGGSTPYNSAPRFEVQCWEISLDGFKDAFKAVVALEENVYKVLARNKGVSSKVKTSIIGDTEYEYSIYNDTYYLIAKITFTAQVDK